MKMNELETKWRAFQAAIEARMASNRANRPPREHVVFAIAEREALAAVEAAYVEAPVPDRERKLIVAGIMSCCCCSDKSAAEVYCSVVFGEPRKP